MDSSLLFWLVVAAVLLVTLGTTLPALARRKAPPAATIDASGTNVAVYRDQLREAEADLEAGLITPDKLAQTRAEIQRRVLEDTAAAEAQAASKPSRQLAWGLAVVIPLASIATYLALGSPQAVGTAATEATHEATPEQFEGMLTSLAKRLERQPDDLPGWLMLGRSYLALDRVDDAIAALRKASAVPTANNELKAELLTELADALARSRDRRLAGEPAQLVAQALALNPQHGKALALAGSAAFEAGQFAQARDHWRKLLALLPPDSEAVKSVQAGIQHAEAALAGRLPQDQAPAAAAAAPPTAAPAAPAGPAAPPAGTAVSGQVTLSPALAAKVSPGDTLFVFARAAGGPRAPLAILRKTAGELPLTFTLDDSMAMSPELRLSAFAQLVVVARISKSGQAGAQSGDLIGQSGPVAPGAQGLKVVIDGVNP